MSVAVVIQLAKRVRSVMFSTVVCLAVPYFSTLCHERCNFRNRVVEYDVCFNFLCNFCLKHFLSHISARYHKCTYVFTSSIRYSFQSLLKLEFF